MIKIQKAIDHSKWSTQKRLLTMLKLSLILAVMNATVVFGREPARTITIRFDNTPLHQTMRNISKQTGSTYFLKAKESSDMMADRMITGKVTDQDGKSLEGVSVTIKGTNIGTTTDVNGNYSLNVKDNSKTIVFSFVGYGTIEKEIGIGNSLDVTLQSTAGGLQEVVLVGYGTKEKSQLTSAVSSLNSSQIEEHRTSDLQKALQGTMPGLIVKDVGGIPGKEDATILIRGTHTLGNNSPLYVIDGVPQNSITNISPYDIEEISVLKDASAAIYGARAANGVILIKTKRGRTGKTNLQVNAEGGVTKLTRIPKLMNSYQYAIYRNEADEAIGVPLQFTDDDIEKYRTQSDPLTHPNTDWYRSTYRMLAPTANFNVSASGGNENVQFFLSGSYLLQDANFSSKDGSYHRYQIRSNVDAKVGRYLKLGGDLSLILGESMMPPVSALDIMHGVWFAWPIEVDRYPNGLYAAVHEDRNTLMVSSFMPGYNKSLDGIIRPKLSLDFDMSWITAGLSLTAYAAYSFDIGDTTIYVHPMTVYSYDPATQDYNNRQTVWPASGHYSLNNTRTIYKDQLYHMRLVYTRRFDKHGLNAFAAIETDETKLSTMTAGRKDLFSPTKVELFAGQEDGRTVGGLTELGGRVNYFGSLSYDYDRRFMLDFTLRSDGSFNFPKGHRFGTFPSVGAAWNLGRENFMQNGKVTNLKLRASYGEMGNDRIPNYQYLTRYNVNSFSIFGENSVYNSGITIANIPNPNITWEIAKTFDFGVDGTIWNNLNFTFDYFNEKRRGILIQRNLSLPLYTAITLPFENLGKVDNWGLEAQLNYHNQIGEFAYSLSGNFTFNRNKIVYMDEADNIPDYQKQEGHPINSIMAYVADGLYQTAEEIEHSAHIPGTVPGFIKYEDLNGDGKINGNDMKRFYKSTTPEIQFGLSGNLKYKKLGVFFMLQGQARALNALRFNDNGSKPEIYFTERWTPDNPKAKEPRATLGFSEYSLLSTFHFKSAAYLRLKTLEVSYDLADIPLFKGALQMARVYLRGRNVFTIDQIKIFDPELPFVADTRGNRARYYPQTSEFSAGVNLSF